MSLTAGIVGLPNVGKSTLFNAITKQNILAANYPFATIEPNVGVVVVPDERLDFLNELYQPKSLVPTTIEFTDIAGLVKGASAGEGLGNKFLSHIRDVDAIVEVVRCFDDENVTHVDGSVDPIRDIEVINVELVLSDLEIVTSRINRIGKKAMTTKNKDDVKEIELLERIKEALESNIPVRKLGLDEEEKKLISSFNLITLKPIIYALNVEDNDINTGNNYTKLVEDYAKNINNPIKGVKIAVLREVVDSIDDKNILEAFNNTIKELKKQGAVVEYVDFSIKLLESIYPTYMVISCAEATSNNANLDGIKFGPRYEADTYTDVMIKARTKGFCELIRRRFIIGSFALMRENQNDLFLRAQKARRLIVNRTNEILSDYDFMCLLLQALLLNLVIVPIAYQTTT